MKVNRIKSDVIISMELEEIAILSEIAQYVSQQIDDGEETPNGIWASTAQKFITKTSLKDWETILDKLISWWE